MRIEDRIYTGLKRVSSLVYSLLSPFMRIEDRIYTGLKLAHIVALTETVFDEN